MTFWMRLISRKLYRLLFMFSTGFTSLSALLLFPLSVTFFSLYTILISPNIDEVLSIKPSANVLVFADFNVLYKDWLNYSSGTD